MIGNTRRTVDKRAGPLFRATRDGQPLSYNRAPAADLAGWIARLSVVKLDLRPGETMSCGLFVDTAGIRVQLIADIDATTVQGIRHHGPGVLFCGPQSRLLPMQIAGDFLSIGVSLRPSGCAAILGTDVPGMVDRVSSTRAWAPKDLLARFDPDASPEDWLLVMEDLIRARIAQLDGAVPNPLTACFEEIAFLDPAMSIAQAAREIDVDRRRLERMVVRDFGMPPKQVFKRARALDMASYLRGVADADEAEALELRYYDESHRIREFVELFGMPPRQFTQQPQPLLTLILEIRQARRLEMLERLAPGAKRPWE